MKKFISFITLITIFSIGFVSNTMSFSSESKTNHSIHKIKNEVSNKMNNCAELKHECCFSPFKDAIQNNQENVNLKNEIKKISDYCFSININFNDDFNTSNPINGPPEYQSYIYYKNLYPSLTGIVKNNN